MNGFVRLGTSEAVLGFVEEAENLVGGGDLRLTPGRREPVVVFENADQATVTRLEEIAARFEGRIVPSTRYAPLAG